jgi:hypothetical protein
VALKSGSPTLKILDCSFYTFLQGGHKSHAFYLVFAFVVRKRIRRSTNALA